MTPASEIIVRWYCDQADTDPDFAEDLVQTLYKGCEARETDSIQLLDRIISHARLTSAETNWEPIIRLAASLHLEASSLKRISDNLNELRSIEEAVKEMPASGLGRKLTMMKIKDCLHRLQPAPVT